MSYYTLLPTLSRQHFSRHSPQTAIKRNHQPSHHRLLKQSPQLLPPSIKPVEHISTSIASSVYSSANICTVFTPITSTNNATAPFDTNEPPQAGAGFSLQSSPSHTVSLDILCPPGRQKSVSFMPDDPSMPSPGLTPRNLAIHLPPGSKHTSLRSNGSLPMGISLLLTSGLASPHKTATMLLFAALGMPTTRITNSLSQSYKILLGIYLTALVSRQSSRRLPTTNATMAKITKLIALSPSQCYESTSNDQAAPASCQCPNAYPITKTCHKSIKRKRAFTTFILLQLMIVFTNPIIMANKTYLKSNNTRTNDPKRTPPRKATSTPGKVSAAKLLSSAGAQKKKVQQTLLPKSSAKPSSASPASQASSTSKSSVKPNLSFAEVASSPPHPTKNPYKASTITPSLNQTAPIKPSLRLPPPTIATRSLTAAFLWTKKVMRKPKQLPIPTGALLPPLTSPSTRRKTASPYPPPRTPLLTKAARWTKMSSLLQGM